MDDFYLIHKDKNYLKYCLQKIKEKVEELGLTLNSKTSISPLKNGIDFLGFHTYLTESGKVIRKLRRSSKTNMRRRLKKYKNLNTQGRLPMKRIGKPRSNCVQHYILVTKLSIKISLSIGANVAPKLVCGEILPVV